MQPIHLLHLDDHDVIACRHSDSPSRPGGYPVLEIEGPELDAPRVTIFPTPESLRRLRNEIVAYLEQHGDHIDDGPAIGVGIDRVDIVPAEAVTVA